jgi:phospholipid/cholesterol/gamma-HCH transport system substrate-binding protein
MQRNMVETLMGAVVLAVAGLFVVFAYSASNLGGATGYEVKASFTKVGGLSTGSDVRMSGIRVGKIISQELDHETFMATVTMSIDPAIKLPDDSTAMIASEGLLGGNYLELTPGGSEDMIEPGGSVEFTQDPVDIVQLLGKFIFSAGSGGAEKTSQ